MRQKFNLQHYLSEGMEYVEFEEAINNLKDLESEYAEHEAYVEDKGEGQEEEEEEDE